MKLLTFLGKGNYTSTLYFWKDREYLTKYAPAASCSFLRPDDLIVFLTEDAHTNFEEFKAELSPEIKVQAIPIPLGKNEQELWQIFDQISARVEPGEDVAFDITNGLRSFPLVGLLSAVFLQFGLDVHLKAVLYGAFDVRDTSVTPNRTSMFDLTPMVKLLEWSSAADRFNQTGDARYLASLIKYQRKELAITGTNDPDMIQLAGSLGGLISSLNHISQSLRLIRPEQIMQQTASLAEVIQKAKPALERSSGTLPFSLLLEKIEGTYTALGLEDPLDETMLFEALDRQRRIIKWYVDREQWVQAITLSREWLINYVMAHIGLEAFTERELRQDIEDLLGSEAANWRAEKKLHQAYLSRPMAKVPFGEDVLDIWSSLTDARNDIDHAGMRPNPLDPEDLIKIIKKLYQRVQALPVKPV